MVWFLVIVGVVVVLQLLYLGGCRRDMELGFASQEAVLSRFGAMIAEIRKKGDVTQSSTEHLEYRLTKIETEMAQLKGLLTQMIAIKADEEARRRANRFSDVS